MNKFYSYIGWILGTRKDKQLVTLRELNFEYLYLYYIYILKKSALKMSINKKRMTIFVYTDHLF